LSREILFTGLFGLGWLLTLWEGMVRQQYTIELMGITAALGFGLVHSMGQVYRLPAAPGWNTWRTNAGFIVSALLLGQLLMTSMVSFSTKWKTANILLLFLLLAQLLLTQNRLKHQFLHLIHVGLITTGMFLTATSLLVSSSNVAWFLLLIFSVIMMEETLGRWLFYQLSQ
jgi:DMSO reductase anchor subunit